MTICILLAAGSSSRMSGVETGLTSGADRQPVPKMLLTYQDKTFLQHCIDEIKNSVANQLIVVTGCYHSLLEPVLACQQIPIVQNIRWQNGMGTSIQAGVEYIIEHCAGADNVIMLVCDQPFISAALINNLVETARQSGKGIVAAAYSGTLGIPVLFDKKYFPQLLQMDGQAGAKRIIQQFTGDVAAVDFPSGAIDIDTPADYTAL